MLDARYFRDQLPRDLTTAGERAVLEVRLLGGQSHRVRAVAAIADGYVTLAHYQRRGDDAIRTAEWQDEIFGGTTPHEVDHAVVPYESILDVLITPGRPTPGPRMGFGATPRASASVPPA